MEEESASPGAATMPDGHQCLEQPVGHQEVVVLPWPPPVQAHVSFFRMRCDVFFDLATTRRHSFMTIGLAARM